MTLKDMVESGEYYDLRTPAYDDGLRSGERDGLVVENGRIFKHGPAGHADGRYPYGHTVRDVTEEALRSEEARREADERYTVWRCRHPVLDRLGVGCHYTRVAHGVRRAHVPTRGGDDWREAGEKLAHTLRAAGYEVELHRSSLNAGKITARREGKNVPHHGRIWGHHQHSCWW